MPNCQTCGAAIAKGLHACPRCGASISADPSPLTPVPRLRLLPQPTSDRAQPQLRPSRRPHQAAPTKTIVPRLGVIGLILSLLGLITPFLALLGSSFRSSATARPSAAAWPKGSPLPVRSSASSPC